MRAYTPETLVSVSRYRNYFPTLAKEIQAAVYARIGGLIKEERTYCDKGNFMHMAQILTSVALYEVLQQHGKSEEEAYRIVSEEMWKFLDPSGMQKLARKRFFLPLMKKIVPFGFRKGSGFGWRYTWHRDDPKDRFRFECNECIYERILGRRGLLKLGAMCCRADIINYGSLPFTDFIRTKTLCQGGDLSTSFSCGMAPMPVTAGNGQRVYRRKNGGTSEALFQPDEEAGGRAGRADAARYEQRTR